MEEQSAASTGASRRVSSYGRKIKANTRLDDLEDAAIKKLTTRKQRKLKEAERRKGTKHSSNKKKSSSSSERKEKEGDHDDADAELSSFHPLHEGERTDEEGGEGGEEMVMEEEEETQHTETTKVSNIEEPEKKKYTPYTSRRKKGRLGSSQDKLPLGEDSEGERDGTEEREKKEKLDIVISTTSENLTESAGVSGATFVSSSPERSSSPSAPLPPPPSEDSGLNARQAEAESAVESVTAVTQQPAQPAENRLAEEEKDITVAETRSGEDEEADRKPEELSLGLRMEDLCPQECGKLDTQQEEMEATYEELPSKDLVQAGVENAEQQDVEMKETQPQEVQPTTPMPHEAQEQSQDAAETQPSQVTVSEPSQPQQTSRAPSKRRKRGRPKKDDVEVSKRSGAETDAATVETKEEGRLDTLQAQLGESSSASTETSSASAAVSTPTANKKAPAKKQKDTYYCKHCDTNFPVGFFRNVQQFGAHCSNCSRGRSLQTPDDSYASRLPTRLQRALKRKKRQEENGGVPRKRGRKATKEKPPAEPKPPKVPKERKQRITEPSEPKYRERRERRITHESAYAYQDNQERGLSRSLKRKNWGDYNPNTQRQKRKFMAARTPYMPVSVNRVDELPQKLILRIFSFLDRAGDLAKAGMTCKLFGRLYNHDSLWKRLFCKQWGESIGYAFYGNWKYRYKARLQYIESRKKPDFLPSLRPDTPSATGAVVGSEGSFCSLPPVKSTPVASHGHWLAEKIVDSQPKTDPITGKSRMEYLIKWEGFGDDWNSWINEEDVWCKELIEEYNSGKIRIPPSRKRRMRHHAGEHSWGGGSDDSDIEKEDWYLGAKRKSAGLAGWGGGKGHLFSGTLGEEDDFAGLWDVDMDEDMWRDTWDTGSSMMSDEDEDEEEYEEVPVTKEEKEKQQTEFLKALEANSNYKPVILFFEKS